MEKHILFEDYLTLGQYLKESGLIATGGQAKAFLADNEGQIFVNQVPENRRGKKLHPGDVLEIPKFDVAVSFETASVEDIAEHQADLEEEKRVKALVKKMNADLPKPTKKPAKPRSPFQRK